MPLTEAVFETVDDGDSVPLTDTVLDNDPVPEPLPESDGDGDGDGLPVDDAHAVADTDAVVECVGDSDPLKDGE